MRPSKLIISETAQNNEKIATIRVSVYSIYRIKLPLVEFEKALPYYPRR
jgi:hypothetical protein